MNSRQTTRRFLKLTLAASVAVISALLTLRAEAGVVYRWVDVTTNPITGPITGTLIIDEDYWYMGATFDGYYAGGDGPRAIPGVDLFYFKGANLPFSVDYDATNVGGFDTWGMSFTTGSVLGGSYLWINTYQDTAVLRGSPSAVWLIDTFSSDRGGPCYANTGELCRGGTGSWVLDVSTVPVPEPASLVMLTAGLGFFGLLRAKRKLT
jgi:PEP-CTERM motif